MEKTAQRKWSPNLYWSVSIGVLPFGPSGELLTKITPMKNTSIFFFCVLFALGGVLLCGKSLDEVTKESPEKAENEATRRFCVFVQPLLNEQGAKLPVTNEELTLAKKITMARLEALEFQTGDFLDGKNASFSFDVLNDTADDEAEICAAVQNAGKLELREVSEQNDEELANGKRLADAVWDKEEIVVGCVALEYHSKDPDGKSKTEHILVSRRVGLNNADIEEAHPSPQQVDAVAIKLSEEGTEKMISLTEDLIPGKGRIAIVFNGEVISAPVVNQVPLGQQFIVEGLGEPQEVKMFAEAMKAPLKNGLVVKTVDGDNKED